MYSGNLSAKFCEGVQAANSSARCRCGAPANGLRMQEGAQSKWLSRQSGARCAAPGRTGPVIVAAVRGLHPQTARFGPRGR
eukprot:scaffold1906_cov403-Prasinococcus_capsulatus_cf.AAC.4